MSDSHNRFRVHLQQANPEQKESLFADDVQYNLRWIVCPNSNPQANAHAARSMKTNPRHADDDSSTA
jgi:hypothetical protein